MDGGDRMRASGSDRTRVACFTPGTLIATPRGERRIETLRAGDRIITRDNGIQEIRWIGSRELKGRELVSAPHVQPVLIRAGALGHGLPERDLVVSPNHRMLVTHDRTMLRFDEGEVLAAAKHLIGAPGVHRIETARVTYLHLLFDRHEVILSNGAWTESFQPGDYGLRGIGAGPRAELFELFPDLDAARGRDSWTAARPTMTEEETDLLFR